MPTGATVLDYGGGDGRWAVKLAERAALVVVADIDGDALRKVPAHPRLQTVLLDGARLPFRSGAFDLVFVNHVLHHVESLPSLVPQLGRGVHPGGRLVVIEFHPRASVTRIYRVLSRYRTHLCTFYSPRAMRRPRRAILFVSSNSFDVLGAKSFGFRVCWINRAGSPLDPLGPTPDMTVRSFDEPAAAVAG